MKPGAQDRLPPIPPPPPVGGTKLTAFSFLFCLIILLRTFARDCPSRSNRYGGMAPSGTLSSFLVFVFFSWCILMLVEFKIKRTVKHKNMIWPLTFQELQRLTFFSSELFQHDASCCKVLLSVHGVFWHVQLSRGLLELPFFV